MEERKPWGHRSKKWGLNFLRRMEHRKGLSSNVIPSQTHGSRKIPGQWPWHSQCRANPPTNKCRSTEWGPERRQEKRETAIPGGQGSLSRALAERGFNYKQEERWSHLKLFSGLHSFNGSITHFPALSTKLSNSIATGRKRTSNEIKEKGNTIGPHQLKS